MSLPIERLVRTLVRDHQIPSAPARTTLRVDSTTTAVPITVGQVGSGTIVFTAALERVPHGRCVLSVAIGQRARVDLPVRITAEGTMFRAWVVGAPLVLRLRSSRNVRLEEALRAA